MIENLPEWKNWKVPQIFGNLFHGCKKVTWVLKNLLYGRKIYCKTSSHKNIIYPASKIYTLCYRKSYISYLVSVLQDLFWNGRVSHQMLRSKTLSTCCLESPGPPRPLSDNISTPSHKDHLGTPLQHPAQTAGTPKATSEETGVISTPTQPNTAILTPLFRKLKLKIESPRSRPRWSHDPGRPSHSSWINLLDNLPSKESVLSQPEMQRGTSYQCMITPVQMLSSPSTSLRIS